MSFKASRSCFFNRASVWSLEIVWCFRSSCAFVLASLVWSSLLIVLCTCSSFSCTRFGRNRAMYFVANERQRLTKRALTISASSLPYSNSLLVGLGPLSALFIPSRKWWRLRRTISLPTGLPDRLISCHVVNIRQTMACKTWSAGRVIENKPLIMSRSRSSEPSTCGWT